MSVTIAANEFARIITSAASAAESKVDIPILLNLHIKVVGKNITVSGTNMDVLISAKGECRSSTGDFATTADAKRLLRIAKQFSKDELLDLEVDERKINISHGRFRATLPVLPADDYPIMDSKLENAFTIEMPCPPLLQAINFVRDAISTEETRYYLCGIYFHTHEGKIRLVATDGHRLRKIDFMDAPDDFALDKGVIIPSACIQKLVPIIGKSDVMQATVNDSKIVFELNGIQIVSKLVDGNYPDYFRVIPQDSESRVRIGGYECEKISRSLDVAQSKETRVVKLEFSDEDMQATTKGELGEEITNSCQIVLLDDEAPYVVGLNSIYISQLLEALKDDNAILHVSGSSNPVKFIFESNDGLAIIMPMRLP